MIFYEAATGQATFINAREAAAAAASKDMYEGNSKLSTLGKESFFDMNCFDINLIPLYNSGAPHFYLYSVKIALISWDHWWCLKIWQLQDQSSKHEVLVI